MIFPLAPHTPLELVTTCEAGLEAAHAAELRALGAARVVERRRAVEWAGDRALMWRVGLEARLGNRLLLALGRFRVRDANDLYDAVSRVDFTRVMTADQTMAVDSRGSHPNLLRHEYVNQVVKDAICDRFRKEVGRRPDVDRHSPDIPIFVHLEGDNGALFLDASGEGLHRRGYRARAGIAPLRESLAAALLTLAEYDPALPFVDPMCGSGTIAIEAALVATRTAPGLLRLRGKGAQGFAFERWRGHDPGAFERVVLPLREQIRPAPAPILASDIDPDVLGLVRGNAELAHVSAAITVSRADVGDLVAPGPRGLLLTNPPYGERLENEATSIGLHRALGDVLKQRFAGWRAGVLAGSRPLISALGLKPTRRFPLWNGPIECRLILLDLWARARPDEAE